MSLVCLGFRPSDLPSTLQYLAPPSGKRGRVIGEVRVLTARQQCLDEASIRDLGHAITLDFRRGRIVIKPTVDALYVPGWLPHSDFEEFERLLIDLRDVLLDRAHGAGMLRRMTRATHRPSILRLTAVEKA